jgi:hypothetical protein
MTRQYNKLGRGHPALDEFVLKKKKDAKQASSCTEKKLSGGGGA